MIQVTLGAISPAGNVPSSPGNGILKYLICLFSWAPLRWLVWGCTVLVRRFRRHLGRVERQPRLDVGHRCKCGNDGETIDGVRVQCYIYDN